MGKIHLFARDNRPLAPTREPKKRNKLLWIVIILIILFVFFRVQVLTLLFFVAGFII